MTVLAIVAMIALTANADSSELEDVMPLFCLTIFLQFLPLLWGENPDPFSPPCRDGLLAGIALVGSLAAFSDRGNLFIRILPHLTSQVRVQVVQEILIATSLGTLSYYFGYYQKIGIRLKTWFPRYGVGPWNGRRLLVVSLFCLAIFIPAYTYFHLRVGTGLFDVTQLAAGKAVWRDDPTSSWLSRSILLGFMPILFVFTSIMLRPRPRSVVFIVLVSAIYFVLITRLGQRGYTAYCGLTLLIIAHYVYRRIPLPVLGALFFIAIIGSNILGDFRKAGAKADEEEVLGKQQLGVKSVLSDYGEDRGRMDALAYGFYAFPSHRDYLMGESYGALLVLPIPRWLMPEKADLFPNRDTGIVKQATGAPIPMPFLGVLYVNFSWVGIVVGMALYGVFHRALYEWMLASNYDKSTVLLYSCILNFFNPTILAIATALSFVVPSYCILHFIDSKRRGAKGAPHFAPNAAIAGGERSAGLAVRRTRTM